MVLPWSQSANLSVKIRHNSPHFESKSSDLPRRDSSVVAGAEAVEHGDGAAEGGGVARGGGDVRCEAAAALLDRALATDAWVPADVERCRKYPQCPNIAKYAQIGPNVPKYDQIYSL